MTYTKEETKWYNTHRDYTCKALKITKNQYNYIRRISNAINVSDVKHCNGEINENTNALEVFMLIKKLKQYSLKIDRCFNYYHQADPRGASLYLSFKPINRDSYNTTAECIY